MSAVNKVLYTLAFSHTNTLDTRNLLKFRCQFYLEAVHQYGNSRKLAT